VLRDRRFWWALLIFGALALALSYTVGNLIILFSL